MKGSFGLAGIMFACSLAAGMQGVYDQVKEIPYIRYDGGFTRVLTTDTKGRTVFLYRSSPKYEVSSIYTEDCGKTWSEPTKAVFGSDTATSAALVADSSGNIYMAFVHINRGISITSSSDAGASWSTPKRVIDRAVSPAVPDDCFLNYGNGYLYLAWTDYRDEYTNSKLFFVASSDKGNTWSEPIQIAPDSTASRFMAMTAMGSEVGVLMNNAFHTDPSWPWDTVTTRLSMITSTHSGKTWSPQRYPDGEVPKTRHITSLYSSLDLERGPDAYYASWNDVATFYLASSPDKGLTWEKQVLYVGDTNISKVYAVEIAAHDSLVAALICINDTTYLKRSTDGGKNWKKTLLLGETLDSYYGTRHPNLIIDNSNRIHAVWLQFCTDSVTYENYFGAFYYCDTSAATPAVGERPQDVTVPEVKAEPNPFARCVNFEISADPSETIEPLIFDATGRLVASLGTLNPGKGVVKISWDGRGENGTKLPSGSYFLKVLGGGKGRLLKIVKLR